MKVFFISRSRVFLEIKSSCSRLCCSAGLIGDESAVDRGLNELRGISESAIYTHRHTHERSECVQSKHRHAHTHTHERSECVQFKHRTHTLTHKNDTHRHTHRHAKMCITVSDCEGIWAFRINQHKRPLGGITSI